MENNNMTIRFNLNNTDFEIDFTNVNDLVEFMKSVIDNNKGVSGIKTASYPSKEVIAVIFRD